MTTKRSLDVVRRLAAAIELRDVVFVGGLILIAIGGSRISAPWTMVGMGAALALLSVPWRK